MPPVRSIGQARDPRFDREPARAKDPELFAEEKAEGDAERHRLEKRGEGQSGERHPRIGKGEDRKDAIRDPGLDLMLELFDERFAAFWRALHRTVGDEGRYRDPGEGGVHARFQHRHPEGDGEEEVGRFRGDPHAVEDEKPREEEDREEERADRKLRGIENRDDDDRGEVVDHRDGSEENLQRHRHPAAEEGEHPEGEGDVRRRGNGPATQGGRIVTIDQRVDRGREDDAPEGREEGQDDLLFVGKFARHDLAFQLEPDEEEEDRHEAVVDPEQDGFGNREIADADLGFYGEELLIPV